MKIMHVADLHLDSPFIGMSKEFKGVQPYLIQAAYTAFERCVSVAINRKVDVMVIVGDVFDAEKQTIYAQHFFNQQLERLANVNIPVIFTHGNHDYLTAQLERRKYPNNVYVFKDDYVSYKDVELSSGETVRFYGFSYKTRWVKQRMIEQFPMNNNETDYTVGLLHGEIASKGNTENNYSPFTIQELLEKNYDYWALGHIHAQEVVHQTPLIQYSGTIQGRHRNESGNKGAYLVELNHNQPTKNEFIPLAPIIWVPKTIECTTNDQATTLTDEISELIHNYEMEAEAHGESYIIDLTIDHAERLDEELQEQIENGELINTFIQDYYHEPFVILAKISLKRKFSVSPFQYDENLHHSFIESYESLEDNNTYNQILSPLLSHPIINQYLKTMVDDDTFKQDIIEKGHDIVVQSLGFTRSEEVSNDEN